MIRFVSAGLLCTLSVGCGGGSPLLHPAHPLPKKRISVGAGLLNNFPVGQSDDAIDDAKRAMADPNGVMPGAEADVADGAVAQTLTEPGLAPWFGARAGLGGDNEMGIVYTGRRVRADLRHAFRFDEWALSLGGGVTGIVPDFGSHQPSTGFDGSVNVDEEATIPRFDGGSVTGYGIDVPILFGWRSQPALVSVWVGLRPVYERMAADFYFAFQPGQESTVAPASGSRLSLGGLVGFAVGVEPVWVHFELDAAYERIEGEVDLPGNPVDTTLEGAALTPAAALVVQLD